MNSPLIIIGMHRSGTSLIAKSLHEMGVFMGSDRSAGNAESRFFLEQNQLIYSLAHAAWDNPEPVNFLWQDEFLLTDLLEKIKKNCNSWQVIHYQGLRATLHSRSLTYQNRFWGWKDPRNTYTLPLWLRVFPKAKVLNVYRNGVDVSISLWRREKKRRGKLPLGHPVISCRCIQLEKAFDLWVEYVSTGLKYTSTLPDTRIFNLSYEDFLVSPIEKLQSVALFLELPIAEMDLESITHTINPDRRFAFIDQPNMLDWYHQVKENQWMKRLGYSHIHG